MELSQVRMKGRWESDSQSTVCCDLAHKRLPYNLFTNNGWNMQIVFLESNRENWASQKENEGCECS